MGTGDLIPAMPPQLEHGWVTTTRRHRVDATRRAIHALNAQKALVFMNFQKRLQVLCQQLLAAASTALREFLEPPGQQPKHLHCVQAHAIRFALLISEQIWLTPKSRWMLCGNEVLPYTGHRG